MATVGVKGFIWYSSLCTHLIATGHHLPYGINVTCHPKQVNVPRLTPARKAGTRFTYPGEMEGWVDLGCWLHTEMAACGSARSICGPLLFLPPLCTLPPLWTFKQTMIFAFCYLHHVSWLCLGLVLCSIFLAGLRHAGNSRDRLFRSDVPQRSKTRRTLAEPAEPRLPGSEKQPAVSAGTPRQVLRPGTHDSARRDSVLSQLSADWG